MHPDDSPALPDYTPYPGAPQPPAPEPPSRTQFPPPDWQSFRRAGISGRYQGTKAGSSVVVDILDLRLDVDPRYSPDSPVLNKVSGDFYTQRLGGATAALLPRRIYVESWIVDNPVVVWSRARAEITGTVRFWRGNHPATTVKITVPWFGGAIQPATVEFNSGATTATYQCSYESTDFRSATLELDYAASVHIGPRVPSYDTHSHNNRPADLSQRTLSIETAYREAGVGVTISPQETVIDDRAAGFGSWSPGELHDAMETAFSRFGNRWPEWNLWGLQAGTFDNPGVGGIMFDAAAGFGGAGRSPERQGFAVFRKHSWFTNLVEGAPTNQDQARAMRHFLYTWVHEAGHAFNFLHSWNKARPNSLSWMNYDWKYDQINGPDKFWANFRFRFDDEELIHLRHGDRAAVIMGGDPWSSGGHLESPARTTVDAEPDQPLELLLRPKPYFAFMEPVEIEIRLRNLTDQPLSIDTRLDPTYGLTTVYVLRPDGKAIQFYSVMCLVGTAETHTMAAAGQPGLDRYSAMIPLTFGVRGFVFDTPGQYELRAVYSTGDLVAISNTAVIRIGQPETKEEDRFATNFFSPEVGLTMSLGGSMSPFLQKGIQTLTEAADRFAGQELGAKAAVVVAKSVGEDFFRREMSDNQDKLVQHHKADPAEALTVTKPALERCQEVQDTSDNIAYNNLVALRAQLHVEKGEPEIARQELLKLAEDLDDRAVNPNVTADIRAKAEELPAGNAKSSASRKTSTSRKTSASRKSSTRR
jgi:hypothetical protein